MIGWQFCCLMVFSPVKCWRCRIDVRISLFGSWRTVGVISLLSNNPNIRIFDMKIDFCCLIAWFLSISKGNFKSHLCWLSFCLVTLSACFKRSWLWYIWANLLGKPIPLALSWPTEEYDILYNDLETYLVLEAKMKGCWLFHNHRSQE